MCSNVIWTLVLLCFPITGCVSAEELCRKCLLTVTNELQNLELLMPYVVQIMWNIWDICKKAVENADRDTEELLSLSSVKAVCQISGGKRLMVETVIGFSFSGILRSSEGQLCVIYIFFFFPVQWHPKSVKFLFQCSVKLFLVEPIFSHGEQLYHEWWFWSSVNFVITVYLFWYNLLVYWTSQHRMLSVVFLKLNTFGIQKDLNCFF